VVARVKVTETDIRRQVRDYLRIKGWFVFHILQGGVGVYRGITDLIAVKGGRVIFLELKTRTGRQSDYQKQFQADLEAAGGEYVLCRGVEDLQERGI
jgi:Holliday junction resolvase